MFSFITRAAWDFGMQLQETALQEMYGVPMSALSRGVSWGWRSTCQTVLCLLGYVCMLVRGWTHGRPYVLVAGPPYFACRDELRSWKKTALDTSFMNSKIAICRRAMRLQGSPGWALLLGMVVCISALQLTAAIDIPLEGEY